MNQSQAPKFIVISAAAARSPATFILKGQGVYLFETETDTSGADISGACVHVIDRLLSIECSLV